MNILGSKTEKAVLFVLSTLSVFLIFKIITETKTWSSIGANDSHVITVSGKGEVFAVPNIANISFTVSEIGTTQKDAQSKAATTESAILKYLKSIGIEEKDIKTESYNVNPQYDYNTPALGRPCPTIYPSNCPPVSNPRIVGYEASETVSVKVRDTSKAGDVVVGVGKAGAKNVSGPNLENDDADSLQDQARSKAIEDAKAKAEELAKELGVRLGKMTSFSENGNYPSPMYAMKSAGAMSSDEASPALPVGENKISSSVTLTYEIK